MKNSLTRCCSPTRLRLIIEINGPIHDALEERGRDAVCQRLIERLGFRFVRVQATDEEHNIEEVLQQIEIANVETKK